MAEQGSETVQSNLRADVPFWLYGILPPVLLALEALSLTQGKPFHDRLFKGEFAIWELGTIIFSFLATYYSARCLFHRPHFPWRSIQIGLVLLAVGSFYLGGEEMSWGQHIFGWKAEGAWADINYQKETNLHNLKEFAFTNTVPRNILTLFVIAGGVFVPWFWGKKLRAEGAWRKASYWFWPTMVCLIPAIFVLIPPIPKKFGWPSLPEPGETEEFYMALFLAIYAMSIFIRKRSVGEALNEVSSGS